MTQSPHEPHPVGELGLLTTRAVARLSGFSQKTVLRAIRAGELPASKVRNEYRVWQADYREWINAARVTPPVSDVRLRSAGSGVGSAARLREMEAEA